MSSRSLLSIIMMIVLWIPASVQAADSYQLEFLLHYDDKVEVFQYQNRFDQPYSAFSGREVGYVKHAESNISSDTVVTNLTSGKVDDGFRVSFTLKNPAFNIRELATLNYQFSRTILLQLKDQASGIQVPETRLMQGQGVIDITAGVPAVIYTDQNSDFRIEALFKPR